MFRRFYTKEEINYIKKLYEERVEYAEIKERFKAEFGRETNGATICKYGKGKKYYKSKRYTHPVPPSHSTTQPAFCAYCGGKLRR